MRVFGTYQQLRRANNRILVTFFTAMAILTLAFLAAVVGHYLLGWW
jgi:hypothetical protein